MQRFLILYALESGSTLTMTGHVLECVQKPSTSFFWFSLAEFRYLPLLLNMKNPKLPVYSSESYDKNLVTYLQKRSQYLKYSLIEQSEKGEIIHIRKEGVDVSEKC